MKQYAASKEAFKMCLDMIGKSDMNSKLRDKTRLGIKKQMTVFNVVKELRHGSEWCNAAVCAAPCNKKTLLSRNETLEKPGHVLTGDSSKDLPSTREKIAII